MRHISTVGAAGGAAAGIALVRAPRHERWTGGGALGTTWAAGIGLATAGVAILTGRGERRTALMVAAVAVAVSDGPAGVRAAARATRRTLAAAHHHGELEQRSATDADLLHTQVQGALRRDSTGFDAPEIQALLKLTDKAMAAIRAPSEPSTAEEFVDSIWRDMVMTVEPYDNPLDRARTWHTAEIERLTLVLTYELRLMMAALPTLSPRVAHSPDPLEGPAAVTAAWLVYCSLSAATALLAPWVTERSMDGSASKFRRRLIALEIAAGAPALIAVPAWPIGAGVVTAVLNLWNREGSFSWSWKVPLGVAGTLGALAAGLARRRVRASDVATTLAAGTAAVLLSSSSYGAWWPFSGTSLVGTALAERRGKARADASAAPWLAEIDRELASAEGALDARGDVDSLFRVRTARARLTQGKTASATQVGEIVTRAVTNMESLMRDGIRVDAGDTITARVRRRNDSRRLKEAIELLISEAAVHGGGELRLRLRRSQSGIEVRAANPVVRHPTGHGAHDHVRPPRGQERLEELAQGLGGAVFDAVERDETWVAGFWFPVR